MLRREKETDPNTIGIQFILEKEQTHTPPPGLPPLGTCAYQPEVEVGPCLWSFDGQDQDDLNTPGEVLGHAPLGRSPSPHQSASPEEGRGHPAEPAVPETRALGDAVTRRGTGAELSGSSASLPSPPFAVFSFSAGPELCDPGSSGAIAVWDKQ